MPKNPVKLFGRRRSSGNALDIAPENPQQPPPSTSSFRVLERPEKASPTFERVANGSSTKRLSQASVRPFTSPLHQLRGKSVDDLRLGANRWVDTTETHLNPSSAALKHTRGSAGTTNSGSSGYYDSSSASARYSSTSTLPSSLDQRSDEDADDSLFPRKSATTPMYPSSAAATTTALDDLPPPPPPPSFSARAARAFSFGNRHSRVISSKDAPPTPSAPLSSSNLPQSPERSHSPTRDRSTTASSYASTAKPALGNSLRLSSSSFGDDFGNLFSKIGNDSDNLPLPSPPVMPAFHRTVSPRPLNARQNSANGSQESEPMFPPKSYSRQSLTPSPNATRGANNRSASPYNEWSDQDALVDSGISSPGLDGGPPVPAHNTGIAPAFLGRSKAGYSMLPAGGTSPVLQRTSSDDYDSESDKEIEQLPPPQKQSDDGDKWIKRVELRDPQGPGLSTQVSTASFEPSGPSIPSHATVGASRLGATSPSTSSNGDIYGVESSSSTPRATRSVLPELRDAPNFDSSPVGPPSRAVRPVSKQLRIAEDGLPKRMTKAQFDMLQRGDAHSTHSVEDAQLDDDDYDDEDDIEHAKKAARQRQKQEANMAVYRQQMKKVTGGGPADLPSMGRPPFDRSANSAPAASMSGLHFGGIGGTPPPDSVRGRDLDNEDDDVPLGILQAHGFPGSGRPPLRTMDSEAGRMTSVAGSVANGGAGQGNLPPFARRLPADPYFGASVVNPAHRESLAMNGAQSVYGGGQAMPQQPQMASPGGLVGVIAGEERARAARRGSPNPITGSYGAMPLPANMPQMPRTMSTGNVPGMMPMMGPEPSATQQQMQQFMQMQMHMMQTMMAMQQQMGQSPQAVQQAPDYFGGPTGGNRPMSMASQAPALANGGRTMTMMNPPTQWNASAMSQQRPGTYAPSMNGLQVPSPGAGYTPSMAPSERSNIGMPSRYRPVSTINEATSSGRSQSMTSSMTLQAFTNPGQNVTPQPAAKTTIRVVDKPKGAPRNSSRPMSRDNDEDDEGWAEMAKKRSEKKFGWRKKTAGPQAVSTEPALSDLYKDFE